jgi:hypothetical protein
VRGQALRCQIKNLSGRKVLRRNKHDPRVRRLCLPQCLAPHPKPSLRPLSPQKSGARLRLNQIACKVAPALAAGCTMILKPSEFTPSSALIFAEILHEAGVPKGVFNLINGLGPEVGAAMSEHPDIDMISFTGSTRAGIDVAKRAAPTVKRVSQEFGGKSPNVILEDADLPRRSPAA